MSNSQQHKMESDERVHSVVHRLEHLCGRSLAVRFHRNRWTYFSCRTIPASHRVQVGLHESFLAAPPQVIEAVATLIHRDDSRARRIIRSFVEAQSHIWDRKADRPPRKLRINPRGQVYDLQACFDDLNRRYFDGQCSARITWGSGSRRARGQRQITFGTYDRAGHVIRIHPALDRKSVPEYFVRYITFHEMLHVMVPAPLSPSGRRLFHSRLFRQREREFDDFQRAQEWGKRFVEDVI